jgi:hypothetical protein
MVVRKKHRFSPHSYLLRLTQALFGTCNNANNFDLWKYELKKYRVSMYNNNWTTDKRNKCNDCRTSD